VTAPGTVLLNSPHNPTGHVASEAELAAVAEVRVEITRDSPRFPEIPQRCVDAGDRRTASLHT